MKKILFALVALASFTLVSCEKEKVGGTALESMAGQWYVTVQGIDEDGSVLYEDEDLYGFGPFVLLTYNDANDSSNKMFIQDTPNAEGDLFWDFKVKVDCDLDAETFGLRGAVDYNYSIDVDITNGKILKGAATTPSGMAADSIVFDVLFEDDKYAEANIGKPGVTTTYYYQLRMTGYRYTGLAADE